MNVMRALLKTAINPGLEIMEIYVQDFHVETKADNSLLTAVDQAANTIINTYLKKQISPL